MMREVDARLGPCAAARRGKGHTSPVGHHDAELGHPAPLPRAGDPFVGLGPWRGRNSP